MKRALFLALLACGLPAPVGAQTEPAAAANGFLAVYGSFHPSDGIPDASGRSRLAPYLSPDLNKLLAEAADAQARFTAKVKDSPPLIEGDLFTSLFEGATQWKLGACSLNSEGARCPVAYARAGTKPASWTDTLILTKTREGWRVDDIAYGGRFQFGNIGRLSDTLKLVLREAP